MPKGKRFGRLEGDRSTMTISERISSRGEEARTNAKHADTPEEKQRYRSQADACKRTLEDRQKSGQ